MAAYLCSVLCTGCGHLYENLIDLEDINDSLDQSNGVMESHNYRCDAKKELVRIRRHYSQTGSSKFIDEIIATDEKLDVCPACRSTVPSFGDRYHVELDGMDAVLRQKCPRCNKLDLMLLSREEVRT